MTPRFDTGLMWFRRDLRVDDNASLYAALVQCRTVYCVFVLDTTILDKLPRVDRRVEFIRESLVALDDELRVASENPLAGLIVLHGLARDAVPKIASQLGVQAVFAGHDDEPDALARDAEVRGRLAAAAVALFTFKDHVVFERRELLTQAGSPYTVFTPYKKAWLAKIALQPLSEHDCVAQARALAARPETLRQEVPKLKEFGFEQSNLQALRIPVGVSGARALLADFLDRMDSYHETRNFPSVKGPSYLGIHLRFGTISVRKLVAIALQRNAQERGGEAGAATWLSELIWRDFYAQILANFPHVAQRSFRPEYDAIEWEQGSLAETRFAAWCAGQTGYPLVDAAMAQINQSGYMHNRLRMVAACFLVKDLGVDWRRGEAFFAQQLNDFDLAANNGGWQWCSSSGCDAQPYFRIFNPVTQSEKFDSAGKFIRRYLPQLALLSDKEIHAPWLAGTERLTKANVKLGENYPRPLVDHATARVATLARYSAVKQKS